MKEIVIRTLADLGARFSAVRLLRRVRAGWSAWKGRRSFATSAGTPSGLGWRWYLSM